MGQHSRKVLLLLLIGAVVVGGCHYLGSQGDLSLIVQQRWSFWAIQGVILAAFFLMSTLFVGTVMRGMDVRAAFRDVFLILMTSQSTNYLGPFKLGVPVRVYLFKKMLGASYAVGVSATLIAQYLRIASIMLICAVALGFGCYRYAWILSVGILVMTAILVAAVMLTSMLRRINPDRGVCRRFKGFVVSVADQAYVIPMRKWLLAGSLALLMNGAVSASSYSIVTSCGGAIAFHELLFIDAFAILVGVLSFMPMGLATRDATYLVLLQAAGVPETAVCAVILLQRIVWSVVPVTIGIVSYLLIVKRLARDASLEPQVQ